MKQLNYNLSDSITYYRCNLASNFMKGMKLELWVYTWKNLREKLDRSLPIKERIG